MSIRHVTAVMDHWSKIKGQQWKMLVLLAENCNADTGECFPRLDEDDSVVSRRMGVGRSQRFALVDELVQKGAIERVRRGQKHQNAILRVVVPLDAIQGPGNPDAESNVRVLETRTLKDAQGPGNPDANHGSGSGFSGLRVPETRTHTPHTPHDSSLSSAERAFIAATGASVEEARETIKLIVEEHKPKSTNAYVIKMAKNGDLPEYLERVRSGVGGEAKPTGPPKCDDPGCHPRTRMIEDEEGHPARCPRCNPNHPAVLARVAEGLAS